MKKIKWMTCFFVGVLLVAAPAFSKNKVVDKKHKDEHKDEHKDDHKDEHKDEHGEERELPAGITFYNDESGEFSLSPEATRNFTLQLAPVALEGALVRIPTKAIVRSLKETTIFLKSGEKYFQVSAEIVRVVSGTAFVKLNKNVSNAQVVIQGVNFLKTVQLSLEEDPSEGHGH